MSYTTVNKGLVHMNTLTYSGNGLGTASRTGVGFQPDMVWFKARSGSLSGENHHLYDSVRGVGKFLIPNEAPAEGTDTNGLKDFDPDGFTTGDKTDINGGSTEYVAWNWKGNGTATSNTDGSITSTVSANTTSGFSIVKYTGSSSGITVGHGLGSGNVPKMIIVKKLTAIDAWQVYHHTLGTNKKMTLNDVSSAVTDTVIWQNTTPDDSVFYLGARGEVNAASQDYIAYCFAEVRGFSKFGNYKPVGPADGNFLYTGFKPSFVMIKNTDNGNRNWTILDSKRTNFGSIAHGKSNFNVLNARINPNNASAEAYGNTCDFYSNGIKLRTAEGDFNTGDGVNYIYMAFAEAPLVGTNNVPCTAR